MKEKDKKSGLILLLTALLVFMAVCYSILFQRLSIIGTVKVDPRWNIKITEVTLEEGGNAVNKNIQYTDNSVNLSANLEGPGDYVNYIIKVENKGNINAKLNDVLNTMDQSKYIKFSFKALDKNGKEIDKLENLKLKSGKYQYFKCRIYFNDEAGNFTGDMETAKNIIVLNYVQDSK